ncbi:hypothetical protein ACA910_016063 [Epithemia clementina (nom. ined.)]
MVFGRIAGWFGYSDPKWPEGQPLKLPDYFPVQPKGCEKQSQKLFDCVAGAATDKQRDIEKAGYHKSYFAGVETTALDEKYASYVNEQQDKPEEERDPTVPRRGENPLSVCQLQILQYQKCCDQALKKKQNWILTEPYRVQKEYRYNPSNVKV